MEGEIFNSQLFFRSTRTIPRSSLLPVTNSFRIEHSADDVVAHPREIFDASSADEDNAVLLEIMAFSHDVRLHFVTIGEADAGDLPESRVRLLRGHGRHL